MRKIERAMLAAIHGGYNMTKENTAVRQCYDQWKGEWTSAAVYLHGHLIAEARRCCDGHLYVSPNPNTWHRYPTTTTGSRLQALGVPNKASRYRDPARAWLSEGLHPLRDAEEDNNE